MLIQTRQRLTGFLGFVKATVIGGLFVLAPIVILVILAGKAVSVAYETLRPLVAYLPFQDVAGVSIALVLGIAALIALCFVAGLLAHTALAAWLVRLIEGAVLSNLPGYSLMKSMGEGLVGVSNENGRRAVLVQFATTSQVGFLMDQLPDGRAVIFIPGVPSPWSGQLHVVAVEHYEMLNASVRETVEVLQKLGISSAGVLSSRQPSRS